MDSTEASVRAALDSAIQPSESTESPVTVSNFTSTLVDGLINASGQNPTKDFVFHFSWLDYGFFVGLLGLSALIGVYYGFFSKHKQNTTSEYILGGRTMKIIPVATSMIATLVRFVQVFSLCAALYRPHCDKSNYPLLFSLQFEVILMLYFLFSFFSSCCSHISGFTLVGLPTEIYSNGTQYAVFVIAAVLVSQRRSNWFWTKPFGFSFYSQAIFCFLFLQLGLALAYMLLPLYHHLGVTSSFEYLERRFDRRVRLLASFVYTLKYLLFIPLVIYVPALAFSQGK